VRLKIVLVAINFRAVIFEQLCDIIYVTTSFFSLFIGQNQWREKKKERE